MDPHLPFILLITLVYIFQVTAPAARGRQQRLVPPALAQQSPNALVVFKGPPQPHVQRPNAYGQRQRDALPRKGTNRPRFGQGANLAGKGPAHYASGPAPQHPNAPAVYKAPPQAPVQRPNAFGQRQRDALARKGTNRPSGGGANLPRKGPAQPPRAMPAPAARPAPRPMPRPTPKKPVTTALVPRSNFAMTKAVPTVKPKPINNPLDVPMELRMKKKATCNPGHAVYDLYWTEPYVGFRKYHVSCLNFTTSCREKCEYSTACTRKKYGENLYVRGIWLVFDAFKNFQHYFLFLCCNTTLVPEDRRCEGKKRQKESTRLNGAVVAMTQLTFREANSTYPDDKTNSAIAKSGQKIYVEACTNIKQKKSFELCPYVQVAQGQSGGGSGTGAPLDPLLATGITSLVLGTIGIALIRRPLPVRKKTCACSCCCDPTRIVGFCDGTKWSSGGNLAVYPGVQPGDCLTRCLSNALCVALQYSYNFDVCYLKDASQAAITSPTGVSNGYCYKYC